MATLMTVNLIKGESPSWGFRLQGGKDFGTPLVIQKVIVGSPAERAGLVAGDSVIKVNSTDVFNLRHKDAQDVLLRAGNSFSLTIQRGGSTWKPTVVPTGTISSPTPIINNVSPVTRTSLAAKPQENIGAIGTGHNVSAKPFLNGNVNGVAPKVVNNQYNSPLKLYSEESIAETLSAQTEVLSTGALGVNFKKNERNYDASKSAVLSLLKEEECRSKTPEHHIDQHHGPSGIDSSPSPIAIAGLRHVAAPENKPQPPSPQLPPGQNICADCERLIVGVFVRIKDKNLHVECFKCSTCGTSLRNIGYYNINNKLYCDIHAKLAARSNPPASNLEPITISPGGRVPANAISAALASHSAPLSPKINSYQIPSSGPKPFGSVSAPISSPPNIHLSPGVEATLSPVQSNLAPSFSPVSSAAFSVSNIVWPPVQEEPELPSACPIFYPPPSQIIIKPKQNKNQENSENNEVEEINTMSQYYFKNMDDAHSLSGRRSASECIETITESVDRQRMIENIMEKIPQPSTPLKQLDTVKRESKPLEKIDVETGVVQTNDVSVERESCDIRGNTGERPPVDASKVQNSNPKKWESQMLQALTISIDRDQSSKNVEKSHTDTEQIASTKSEEILANIPITKPATALGSALAVAPTEPFNPVKSSPFDFVPLPEETIPYLPPEGLFDVPVKINEDSGKAKFRQKNKKSDFEKLLDDLPKPRERLTMLSALTTVPDRPFTPSLPQSEVNEPNTLETAPTKSENLRESKELDNRNESHTQSLNSCVIKNNLIIENQYANYESISQTDSILEVNKTELTKVSSITRERNTESDKMDKNSVVEPIREQHNVSFAEPVKESPQHSKDKIHHKKVEKLIPLRRPEIIPQYQINVRDNAEADLIAMEKMERSKRKKELEEKCIDRSSSTKMSDVKQSSGKTHLTQNQESSGRTTEAVCPSIKVVGGNLHSSENTFKPVVESASQNLASSPAPIPHASNIANKPLLPYYQANLVAHKCGPPVVNLLDPKSPAISRSPSPFPNIPKPTSLFSPDSSNIRPKSPAQGPPDNPMLQEHVPLREDFKREVAKDSVSSYIPQYKQIEDNETKNIGKNMRNQYRETMYTSEVLSEKKDIPSDNSMSKSKTCENIGSACVLNKNQVTVSSDYRKEENKSEDFRETQITSSEKSTDGSLQIHRKKTVTEEIEHMYKSEELRLEKHVTEVGHCFRNVNNPEDDQHVVGLHITAPNRIKSPFMKTAKSAAPPVLTTVCQKVGKDVPCKKQEILPPVSCPIVPKFDASTLPQPKTVPEGHWQIEEKKTPVNPVKHVPAPGSSNVNQTLNPNDPPSGVGATGGRQIGAVGVSPKRGRGVLNAAQLGGRVALCGHCHGQIRGPFITALGKIWCPSHFVCATPSCKRPLHDMGFVEEDGNLYCEYCFEQYLAPYCSKCESKIKGDCLRAIGKSFHPECFNCVHCGKLFGNSPFFLEDGSPYCDADWNELFTTKCFACGFPVEAGDRWVEALNNNYHSQCFNCTMCKKNLEGQSFFAKGGRPYCKNHAR